MKWEADIKEPRHLRAVIEKQWWRSAMQGKPGMWAYSLFIYEGNNTRCTWDYLQDTFEIAIDQAHDDFGIPISAWKQVD